MEGHLAVAHIVPAIKCVFAIPWQPVSQPLQQSGTLPEMMAHQQTLLQGVIVRFGGGTTGVVAGRKALLNVQTLVASLHDGGLAMLNTTLCVVLLSLTCLS